MTHKQLSDITGCPLCDKFKEENRSLNFRLRMARDGNEELQNKVNALEKKLADLSKENQELVSIGLNRFFIDRGVYNEMKMLEFEKNLQSRGGVLGKYWDLSEEDE